MPVKNKITISEIARLAGVSKTTVSRVINEKPDVDPQTRERILGLINDYSFQPNAFAKAISLQKSNHIGLIIPHDAQYVYSNPFYTEVMRGVSTEVDQTGYYLVLCFAHETNYLDIYRQKRVDGFVLLSPGSYHRDIIESLNEEQVPFVSTAKISDQKDMTYVDVDNFYGATVAMEYLVAQGHRKIAYIGKPTLQSSIDRLSGYRAVMEKYDLPCCDDWVLTTNTSSVEGGYAYTSRLLQQGELPTAIFLANDVMAIGAINALRENGLRVPEDMSVFGFDDIPLARYTNPSLSTIRQPAFEKGMEAARLLVRMLESDQPAQSLTLPVELVVRQSTAAPTA
jgi:LacI family transcriptional regulator